jgi:hypothetical protein
MVSRMRSWVNTRGDAARRLRARLGEEAGSMLIEVMVSSVILLLAGAGVLNLLDRGSQLSGQQRLLATAANVAQSEQERLRGYSVTSLSNLREIVPRTVNGTAFTVTSRTDWVDDASGDANCTTAAASADYMKLTTTVTYPTMGTRKPVVLESVVSPPARAFGLTQGSLSVHVRDRLQNAVAGIGLNLGGPKTLSDTTSAAGCVLWGYLPAGSGYTITGSQAGYVQPDGSTAIARVPSAITGGATNDEYIDYDLAGGVRATFTTQRVAGGALTSTAPQKAMIANGTAGYTDKAFPVTGDTLDSGLTLFPFPAAYSIYAGTCVAAKPPVLNVGTALALPGVTSSPAAVQIPALNISVKNNGVNVASAVVKVTSCATTTYSRLTTAAGLVDDPGFPYGSVDVCVSNGLRKRVITGVANTTYPATAVTYDVASGSAGAGTTSTGACP